RLEAVTAELAQPAPKTAPVRPQTLWDRIRGGFKLPAQDQRVIDERAAWYGRHQSYLDRVAERAHPYLYLIVEAVAERDMPMEIALLPVVESAFQPFAYSHGRAAGLWQFVPATGRRFGLKQNWWYDGRRDVLAATEAALDYLEYLHERMDGDWLLALASYNSGEGTVLRAVRRNERRGRPTDFWHLDLPRETRGYVPQLLALSRVVADPDEYGVRLKPLANEPQLAAVDVGSQIDLSLAAEMADLSIEELYRYNPAFNRWATAPKGPHRLLVPEENAPKLQGELADHPPKERLKWTRHRIRSGESLLALADRYRTTVDLLKRVNNLRGNTIRAGDTLVIPVARKELSSYRLSADQRRRATQNRERDGRNKVHYTVKRGDTLWEIARRFDVGVRQLAGWNAMAPRDPLHPGKRLVVWVDASQKVASAAAMPASFTHPQMKSIQRRIGYTVRSGDSLARISQRFRVSIQDLRRWNDLQGEKYLHPGQRLTLYVDVTRQSGNI
ncbi:MAG TPA: LysM peptidoglycan-binding domain-containing protein, partial [Gammaproteobacteria bacterium]|nr:LysM peptidoglycan-binding domain-containing protein [Gammaproteobacteria bacterium]